MQLHSFDEPQRGRSLLQLSSYMQCSAACSSCSHARLQHECNGTESTYALDFDTSSADCFKYWAVCTNHRATLMLNHTVPVDADFSSEHAD